MLRHTANMKVGSDEILVHSSVIYALKEGKLSHINVEFNGQWIHSFNNLDSTEQRQIAMKTKSGVKLMMVVLTVPPERILWAAKSTLWLSRDGKGLYIGKQDRNQPQTHKLRKKA